MSDDGAKPSTSASIWWHAFGYFACYVPYAALVKVVSSRPLGGGTPPLSGPAMLPITTLTSLVAMVVTFSVLGWWGAAAKKTFGSLAVPFPRRWTFLSGVATAAIIVTTTMAYAFANVSVPLAMILMRGGVLMLSPIVDVLTRRKVRWFSWVALGLSCAALLEPLLRIRSMDFPWLAGLDIGAYLLAYFVRLRFMTRLAKTESVDAARAYFVEEQMVATPFAFLLVVAAAWLPWTADAIRAGFAVFFDVRALAVLMLIGIFSQGTGFFGGLVLLDARENTFCVPLNRTASILAGLVASLLLLAFEGGDAPTFAEIIGAVLLVGSVAVLWVGGRERTHAR